MSLGRGSGLSLSLFIYQLLRGVLNMKECSLPHHVSGVCNSCPNKEECGLKVILAMQKVLDKDMNNSSAAYLLYTNRQTIGDSID